ncbi:MAG: glycosyltransferase family 87 protein [Blastocatellia bacterium]
MDNRKRLRAVLLMSLALLGAWELFSSAYSMAPSISYRKDFVQEYLMAKAILHGIDPYLPVPELASRFSVPETGLSFPHHSAHPPVTGLISLPFALLSYYVAAGVWFMVELGLIVWACYLLIGWWREGAATPITTAILLAVSLCVWGAVTDELIVGQLNSLQLVLLIYVWLSLRNRRDAAGGVFLGLAIAIKALSWPIVLFLLLRRNWRAAIAAGTTALGANTVALLVIGVAPFRKYFTSTSAMVFALYRAQEGNFSAWSLGWRIFEGTHDRGYMGMVAPPLHASATLAVIVSAAIPVLILLVSLWLAWRTESLDHAYALMICACILVSPVAWSHYLLLTLLALAIVFRQLLRLSRAGLHDRKIYGLALLTGALLFLPRLEVRRLIYLLETHRTFNDAGDVAHHVSFAAALISMYPMAGLLSLMWLLWIMAQKEKAGPETAKELIASPGVFRTGQV